MKNTLQINGISFTDPKTTAQIEEQNLLGQSKAKLLASTHIHSGKPPLCGGLLKNFIEPISTHYNSMLAELNDKLQSKLQIQLGSGKREEKSNDDKDLQQKIALEESSVIQKNKSGFINVLLILIRFFLTSTLCLALFIADWLYLSRSLQILVETYFASMMLGLGIASANLAICHLSELWISTKIQSKKIRNIARLFVLTLVVIVFISLGVIRQQFGIESSNHESPLLVFVGINCLLFLALFLIMELSLNPMIPLIKDAFVEFMNSVKAKRKLNKIEQLKNQLIEKRKNLNEYLEGKLCILAFHRSSELKIERYYFQAVSSYKEIIIQGSPNGIPECLDDEIPELKKYTDEFEPKKEEL